MSAKLDTIAETGLQFFGKMTASISHEIKNVLAIINENAGLLEDLTLMIDRGAPIDPERLKRLSQTVMKQIHRADVIVKNMNRFAHSTDESFKSIDLSDALELVVALSNRLASMRQITLELKSQGSPVKIRTSPYLMMNLVGLCLDVAMQAAGDDKTVELVAQKTETGAQIRFGRLESLPEVSLDDFPAECHKGIFDLLKAELVFSPENQEFVVKLPENIDGGS